MLERIGIVGSAETMGAMESQTLQSRYIFEPSVLADEYHVDVVKEKLTRSLPTVLPDVIDEVTIAIKDHISTREDGMTRESSLAEHMLTQIDCTVEWTSVEVLPVMQKIIARVSNRAFVGLPLCEKAPLALRPLLGMTSLRRSQ